MSPREENADLLAEITALRERVASLTRENTELQEQQTATSEILNVISSSPTDVQPVFDAIVRRAHQLLDGHAAALLHLVGDDVHLGAYTTTRSDGDTALTSRYPLSINALASQNPALARVLLEGEIDHIPDSEDPSIGEFARSLARARGHRSRLMVPLRRGGTVVGGLAVTRVAPGRFSEDEIALLQTFADQAVIAIENVRLFTELQQKNEALTQAHAQVTESLEQQTATADILRVISSSPTNIQPVLDTVAERAARLCEASDASIFRLDQDGLRLVAHYGPIPYGPLGGFVVPLVPGMVNGRAVLERRTIHVADLQAEVDEFPDGSPLARRFGYRSSLSVPLMRENIAIGVIHLRRTEAQLFTDRQVALLQTFANQAVIAIENVRLFNETKEALEQQTATSEILRVIASSPTDIQPVFDAVAESAARLCEADSTIFHREGERLRLVAHHGPITPAGKIGEFTIPAAHGHYNGRCVLEGRIIHVADAQAETDEFPEGSVLAQKMRLRGVLNVPLMREGVAIGTISLRRSEARLFTDRQVALLQTFADQAVIAIENVRLFTELQEKNRALTESLDQQTATSEVLKVISRSAFDLQPVLETLVENATRLCGADRGFIFRLDGGFYRLAVAQGGSPDFVEFVQNNPIHVGRGTIVGRTALERRTIHIPDILQDPEYRWEESQQRGRFRTLLGVPMLREGVPIGVIAIWREEVRPFSDKQIELVTTFADQAVIAIENVRLFRELEVANRELAAASQHKSEFLANMSHELRTPLNAIIGFSEVLSERMFGDLNEKQEEYLKDIYASGTHLLSLINDILDLSKIEAGRMELELSDFHLPTALDNALMLVRERATRRGIALHTNVDERLGQIQADERKIRQVVLNLLSNAIKFTPEGGRIEVGSVLRDGSVEVSVSDTGVGIAPEDLEKVFEEFRQVGTADKKAEGTGLGLTLCRKLVELHGGKIWVKSQVGVGSTFTFTIPVRQGV